MRAKTARFLAPLRPPGPDWPDGVRELEQSAWLVFFRGPIPGALLEAVGNPKACAGLFGEIGPCI